MSNIHLTHKRLSHLITRTNSCLNIIFFLGVLILLYKIVLAPLPQHEQTFWSFLNGSTRASFHVLERCQREIVLKNKWHTCESTRVKEKDYKIDRKVLLVRLNQKSLNYRTRMLLSVLNHLSQLTKDCGTIDIIRDMKLRCLI